MDDFPAGPASPGPRRPPLSVVIPVRNGGRDFERCLRRLRASTYSDYELIVVDDGSADGSAALAESCGALVVRHEGPKGPAAARNAGAEAASAPIVFFLDADVALHPDALARAVARFEADSGLAALFGSYDDAPTAPGLVSQYRNLLHHYFHQRGEFKEGSRPVRTFWTGCGAIRRRVFLELGGFDPKLYRRPAIEDIELGYRITRAGHRIELVRDLRATHLKRWTLPDVLRTDIFRRGVPWVLLLRRAKIAEADLNVSRSQRASVALTGLGLSAASLTPWMPGLGIAAVAAALAVAALNLDFYGFLARKRGVGFAVAALPLHAMYFVCCGLSVAIALAIGLSQSLRSTPPATTARTHPAETTIPAPATARARRSSRWTRT
jgi:glycosyltransferase involved in cell wall biosynthesis